MGQKVHPTGFRTGLTKPHKNKWFADFNRFSKLLRHDAQITKIWNEFITHDSGKLDQDAQITRISIQRIADLLQLDIYAKYTHFLVTNHSMFLKLRKKLIELDNTKEYRVRIHKIENEISSSLIAKRIANDIEKRMSYKRALMEQIRILKASNCPGFKIQLSGRLNGVEIARSYWVLEGKVPLQTLSADIDYKMQEAKTPSGIIGIKVWIFNGKIVQ